MDERNPVIDIERVHHVTLSLVQVHRTRVHGPRGLAGLCASQHPTGIGFDDGDAAAGCAADVHVVVRVESGGREIPIPAQSQETLLHQRGDHRFRPPPTHLAFRKGHFGCCAKQLRTDDVGVRWIDHHLFNRFAEQGFRMVDQVGVQRVVPGDKDHEGALAPPPASARLLPERGHGAGKSRQQHGVQPGDVDTQLEGVGSGQAAQLAFRQCSFDRTAILGEVTRAIGGHRVTKLRRDVLESCPGGKGGQFSAAPGPHKGQCPCALHHQVGHHPGGFSARGPAHGCAVLTLQVRTQLGFPQRNGPGALRGAVDGDLLDGPAYELGRRRAGRGGGGAGENYRRGG